MLPKNYYCNDHSILTSDEETQLFEQYSLTKSETIKNKIIEHNLKFAIKCARSYVTKYPHVDPADLTGYAMMGLIDSVDKFDHTRGIKFISFAVYWIKNFIIRNVETNESMIRYPANIHRDIQQSINERRITTEITDIFHSIKGGYSLDQPISESINSKCFADILESPEYIPNPEQRLDNDSLKTLIEQSMVDLDEREKYVIRESFGLLVGEKRTMRDIADELGISHENVRYIKNISMKKMKKHLKKFSI